MGGLRRVHGNTPEPLVPWHPPRSVCTPDASRDGQAHHTLRTSFGWIVV
jgi:hypothetical protein